jgi:hypothetical protein
MMTAEASFTDKRCDAYRTGRALEVMDHNSRRKLFHAAVQGHRGLGFGGFGGPFGMSCFGSCYGLGGGWMVGATRESSLHAISF